METDEPPPNPRFETITLTNGEQLTPGEAFSRLVPKKTNLLNTLERYLHIQKPLTPEEINELEQKIKELGEKRYQSGQMVTISENPDLYKNPLIKYKTATINL